MNDNPSIVDIETFLSPGGAGNDLTIHIQDTGGVASFEVAGNLAASSTVNNARFTTPAAFDTVISRIADGDLFIFAFTREIAPDPLEIGGTATLPSLTAEGGVELSDVAPLEIGGASTLPGLTAAGGVSLSDVAPLTIGGTATMPGLTATGGVELSTVAPLEIGGAATLPGLTAAGGVALVDGIVLSGLANRDGVIGLAFTMPVPTITGGTAPYTFSATGLPSGLNVHAPTGLVYGVPSATGTTAITLTVTDGTGDSDSASFDVTVAAAQAVKADRDFFDDKLRLTPARNPVWTTFRAYQCNGTLGPMLLTVQSSLLAYQGDDAD